MLEATRRQFSGCPIIINGDYFGCQTLAAAGRNTKLMLHHPAALAANELLSQCDERRTRRSGPGGQHRNKVETAVILTHRPTGLIAEASERRSQALNRRMALQRMRMKLAIEWRQPGLVGKPSALWQSRTKGRRLVIAADHDDCPALLAEALDHLQATGWETAAAALALGVSRSQLIKLFRQVPAAWIALNRRRKESGLPLLK
ncbi:MAG: peptide chain release factor-like protein [Planctomycetia bacterium]|nr:peptide chain release factor-like protein [Planctomycetia bacterium]